MTLDAADLVGLVGSVMMAVAYAYSNMARTVNFVLFNLLNLVGAVLLLASLLVHFNLASFLLEVIWLLIALVGLVRALRRKAWA